ncbi:hypothetical protein B0T16DRAFT_447655 [Cercophora newfieldiana]|uniref:Fucose-specific lectin n=1 Tax=Cercophora newfieldiana TaxID=92897 RepID=A0AA39Y0T3_9PEZI|nr:hypothetical protein B0T16DRAFT_447655 [Cercophora newfieldiana]
MARCSHQEYVVSAGRVFSSSLGGIVIIILAAVGAGIGIHFASRKSSSSNGLDSANSTLPSNSSAPTSSAVLLQDVSLTSLHWVEGDGTNQYRVYYQPPNQTSILESSWNSNTQAWTVNTIANGSVQTIRPNTPLAASAGFPNTEPKFALVTDVYFLQSTGTMVEWQNPIHGRTGVWRPENASGLFAAPNSALFAYWHQDLQAKNQTLLALFQDSPTTRAAAWCFQEREFPQPWKSTPHRALSIHPDGSSLAAAPAGDGRDLRIYLAGADDFMKQHAYNIESDVLGPAVNTPFALPPGTPLAVVTEDNRNFYAGNTRPGCTRPEISNAFLTHLILFATPDRRSLTLASWNCSRLCWQYFDMTFLALYLSQISANRPS